MIRDKTTLPFEVTYSERASKKSRSMKRLAMLLKLENVGRKAMNDEGHLKEGEER